MQKVERLLTDAKTKYIILILAFILFCITYLASKNTLAYYITLGIKDIILGVLISLYLITVKNNKYVLFPLLLYAFSSYSEWATYMQDKTLLISVSIIIGLCLVSGIIHQIRFKHKIKFQKFGISLLAYAIAFGIGGLFSKEMNGLFYQEWWMTILAFIGSIFAWFIVIYFASSTEAKFSDLANYMVLLSVLLMLEFVFYALLNITTIFQYKADTMMYLRWGDKNTFGVVLLLAMPFCLYYVYKNIHRVVYLILYFIQFITLLLVSCKGGALSSAIGTAIAFIILLISNENKVKNVKYFGITLIIVLLFTTLSFLINPEMRNLGTLSSRGRIYKEAFEIFKSAPIFGCGYFGMLKWNVDSVFGIQFVHNTFLQILANSGIVGLILMLYHLAVKYIRVLYRPNLEKIIMLFSFLFPEIYGMINPTYPLPTYLIPFAISIIFFENEIKDDNIKYLF